MTRDPHEIQDAYQTMGFTQGIRRPGVDEFIGGVHYGQRNKRIRDDLDTMEVESYLEVNYTELMKDPLAMFDTIKKEGWPIDPKKAVRVVKPKYYRHRGKSE